MAHDRMPAKHRTTPENPAAKGVAVVLNRQITNVEGVTLRYLIPGKAMLVTVPWCKRQTLTILAVYAPSESAAENAAFWDELNEMWMTIDLPVPDTFGGDINLVEEAVDRMPHHADDERAVAALANFKRTLTMIDGWRKANPNTKAYTYTSTQDPPTHSRLDPIYVSPELYKNCRGWAIEDCAGNLTDHKMVSVTISAPGAPFIGKGRYAIPLRVLEDKERTEEDNPQNTFKEYKMDLVDFARKRAKITTGATEQKKQKLKRERDQLLNPEATETAERAPPEGIPPEPPPHPSPAVHREKGSVDCNECPTETSEIEEKAPETPGDGDGDGGSEPEVDSDLEEEEFMQDTLDREDFDMDEDDDGDPDMPNGLPMEDVAT
ncbi:hypothetical protein C8F01DRAFT_1292558 [Mycena amicta]|nr:hypothetical protein C8F01DRAFT_1292558 [Mycena amicta]